MKHFERIFLLQTILLVILELGLCHEMELMPKVSTNSQFKAYEKLFQNLSMDHNKATCAVSEWRKFTRFQYELENTFKIKQLTLIMIDQDKFDMLVSVANYSSESGGKQCKVEVAVRTPFLPRREVTVVCEDNTYGSVIIIQDQRNSNEFFGICEITILGEPENVEIKTEPSLRAAGFFDKPTLEHLYLGLGCLSIVIIVIVVTVCLVKRERRRRNSESAPYYAWSNGANAGSEETIVAHDAMPNSRTINVPGRFQVPLPLPRNAQIGHSTALRHLQGRSDSNPNHYSAVEGQSDYLTILDDPNNKGTFDPHLYEECGSVRVGESLYADCTTLPQPPNTRFSQLNTFLKYPGHRRDGAS